MNYPNYKVLKSNIIKACKQTSEVSMKFEVDYDKLKDLVQDINLVPVKVGMESARVAPTLVPYLAEYFEKTNLSWFTEGKFSTVLCFVDTETLDDTGKELLEKIATPQVEDPDDDKVNDFATIAANYRCFFATVVSYQNNDPNRVGKASYVIICRANKVVMKSSDYQYNPRDFS